MTSPKAKGGRPPVVKGCEESICMHACACVLVRVRVRVREHVHVHARACMHEYMRAHVRAGCRACVWV